MLVGAMRNERCISIKNKGNSNGTKIFVDRDFFNIWWLLKEPFVWEL